MRMSREPEGIPNRETLGTARYTSVPGHIEEWLDNFFDGSPTVRFSCTPEFYDWMYFRLRESASQHGYDPDLIVGLGGTLEFRRQAPGKEQQTEPARYEPLHEATRSPSQNELPITGPLSPDELMSRLELLRDKIAHDSARRRELACRAVAAGIKKTRVYSNAGVAPPTLNKWLSDHTSEENDHEPDRHLILRRLQATNSHIRSSKTVVRELASEAAIAIGDVSKVARAAGLSRQAIYRWLKSLNPTAN